MNETNIPIDIIPLFNTIEYLRDAHNMLKELYSNQFYKNHLFSRGNRQTIMCSFSDSTKDGGYLSANWNIF